MTVKFVVVEKGAGFVGSSPQFPHLKVVAQSFDDAFTKLKELVEVEIVRGVRL